MIAEKDDAIYEHVKEVYVLLKENYRISRNIRMVWFFNNILKDVTKLTEKKSDGSTNEEIRVLSWSGKAATSKSENSEEATRYLIHQSTTVHFLSRGYRLVFALDLSPSAFEVSIQSHSTIAENILTKLAECLCNVMKPVQVPYCDYEFSPNIYVTVFVQTLRANSADGGRYKQEVIIQSCLLTRKTIGVILTKVEKEIFRNFTVKKYDRWDQSSAKHDHGLVSMLRTGLLALQLLPSNTSAGIVVITDGITGVPDMAVLETLVNHLRSSSTTCSMIHVAKSHPRTSYAYCPNVELLQFIARATYGTYIDASSPISDDQQENIYHKALLFWQFHTIDTSSGMDVRNWQSDVDLRYSPDQKNMLTSPVLRKKQYEKTLRVSMYPVLTVRLREGCMITSVSLEKNNSVLQVELIYPWNHSASLKYIVSATWPNPKNQTKVEVYIDATYEFLSDMHMTVGRQHCSRYKEIVFKRFTQFIKGLSQIDHMLTHLMSFASDPENLRPLQNRLPLFYLPPNSNQLVLSMQNDNDSSKSPFVVFWKPILSLDTGIWQKWLHTHHIDLVLLHDTPLPKHLHTPSKSGRYHSIQCSSAMSQVTSILREWCTFILLENNTYIKFVSKKNEEKPSFFYIIRLSKKLPVLIVRLAFLIGTPGAFRNQVLTELREKVLSLTLGSSKSSSRLATPRKAHARLRHLSSQPSQRTSRSTEKSYVTLTHKPLDRILIQYKHCPSNFMHPPTPAQRISRGFGNQLGGEIAPSSMLLDPCKYLEFSRNVWSVTNRSATPLSLPIVGQIANLLVQLRLSEGYHFASTSSGVVAMVKEYPVISEKSNQGLQYCSSQYVIFPPTSYTPRDRRHFLSIGSEGEEDGEDGDEEGGELFLSTESWVEPQAGIIIDEKLMISKRKSQERMALFESSSKPAEDATGIKKKRSLSYENVSEIITARDMGLLKVVVTLEHLRLMCASDSMRKKFPQNASRIPNKEEDQRTVSESCKDTDHDCRPNIEESKPCIKLHPCLFDFTALLDRCPRMKLRFMTLSQDVSSDLDEAANPNSYLFELFHGCIGKHSHCEAELSPVDCAEITRHLLKRESKPNSHVGKGAISWKCFLKVLPKAKIMITLVVASVKDLANLTVYFGDMKKSTSEEDTVNVSSDKTQVDDPEPAQDKEKAPEDMESVKLNAKLLRRKSLMKISTETSDKTVSDSDETRYHSLVLPVFIYECSTSSVTESLLKNPLFVLPESEESPDDTEEDHRIQLLDDSNEVGTPRPKFFRSLSFPAMKSQLRGSSDEAKTPEATTPNSPPESNGKIFSETLVDAYHRCFVHAALSVLRKHDGKGIASADVQAVTDAICIETVQEIDITQFLLISCPQVAHFKNQYIMNSAMDTNDSDEVFIAGGPHIHLSQPETTIGRRNSSTSSNADTSQSKLGADTGLSSSDSDDQSTRGSKNQISRYKLKIKMDDPKLESDSSERHSAFKKPRRRPQSFPKTPQSEKRKSDTDGGNALDAEKRGFRPIMVDSNRRKDVTFELNELQGKAITVGTPLKKLPVFSKVVWADLPDFPVSLLKENHLRHISGTDDQVKANFSELLSENFQAVHSLPDIHFLREQRPVSKNNAAEWESEHECDDRETSDHEEKMEVLKNGGIQTTNFIESQDDVLASPQHQMEMPPESDLILHNMTGMKRSFSDTLSGSLTSLSDEDTDDENRKDAPLFLCITCTVRDKKTGNHGTMLVHELPTNLTTILSCLEEPCDIIGLSDLSITLDLIWMVLPPEAEIDDDYSLSEHYFNSGLLPDDEDSPRHESGLSKQRSHFLPDDAVLTDPLSSVSRHTRDIVDNTKNDIDWLIKDEIISAIRTCELIDSRILEEVVQHIQNSSKDNCVVEEESLKFVFGPANSSKLFRELFEQKFHHFKGYGLKDSGRYYYLVMERTFMPIQNWHGKNFSDAHFDTRESEKSNDNDAPSRHSSGTKNNSKPSQDSKEFTPERATLAKTKSSNDSSRSPPAKLSDVTRSSALLPRPAPGHLRSSASYGSLPSDAMSLDAIESDVRQGTGSGTKPSTSVQSTPISTTFSECSYARQVACSGAKASTSAQSTPSRKTTSAFDAYLPAVSSSSNLDASPDVRTTLRKYTRGAHPRRSLPVTPTCHAGPVPDTSTSKPRPVAQRSFDSGLNDHPDRFLTRQISGPATRLSPLCAGSASPSTAKLFSARPGLLARRRSTNGATPVSQISSFEPSSSTPLTRSEGAQPQSDRAPKSFVNSAYLFDAASKKEAMYSPVSLSDGEIHRYSTASCFESGYDGEESDLDGDDCCMRSVDGRNDLPSFWLIIDVENDKVKIYFHRRNTPIEPVGVIADQRTVFEAVKEYIATSCKCVNQKLLLLELHDTRMCNALLVEGTGDDIWKDDQYSTFDERADDGDSVLLADVMTTAPGQFECECVLEKSISIHPRVKMTVGVSGRNAVVGTVRQLMTNLMVMNRKDMFVYQMRDKSVCYCRMSEDPVAKPDSRRSSQLIPASSDTSATETLDRRMSKESTAGDAKSAGNLILRWYGIGPLSAQQEQELEQMNESVVRRFNEVVLEKITVILQRHSKLSPHDVLFIQPTVVGDSSNPNSAGQNLTRPVLPNIALSYTLPEEFACCISAFKYYLHQNLLQFMALPKYVDSTQPVTHFVAYRMKGGEDISRKFAQHEGSVYLFHQNLEPGKSGCAIACVVLEISDIEGNATPTYSQMKLQPLDSKNFDEIVNLTEVDSYQEVVFAPQASRSGTPAMIEQMPSHPPPNAVGNFVRFHLWLKGASTADDLHRRLRDAVRHALHDCITELFVLRPPLSGFEPKAKRRDDVLTPMEYQKSKRVQARFTRKLSLPSHGLAALSKRWTDGDHSPTIGSASPDGGRTEAMRSLFVSLNDPSSAVGRAIFPGRINQKLEQSGKEEDGKSSTGKISTTVRRQSAGAQSGEESEIGTLNEVYQNFAQDWFNAMHAVKCPSVFQQEWKLSAKSHLKDFILNLRKILTSSLTDCKVKIFSRDHHDGAPTSVNLDAKKFDHEREVPSQYVSFTIIARNFPLWRKSVGQSAYSESVSYGNTIKFRPYDALARLDQSPRPQEHRFTSSSTFISRQQFVMICVGGGRMKLWGYNVTNDPVSALVTKLTSCKHFHEARWRARNCLTFQKLGLFRHCSYETGYPNRDNSQKGINPYARDVRDVDMVLAQTEMPSDGDKRFQQQRSKSNRRVFFKEAYLNHKPVQPLQSSAYADADTTLQYTKQYLEMKADVRKVNEQQQILQRVYANCRDRSAAASQNVLTKDTLKTLLRHARTIHHVTSSILVSPYFRRSIPGCKPAKTDMPSENSAGAKEPTVRKRKKRLSGSMRKSGEFSGKNPEETRSRSNSTRKEGKGSKSSLQHFFVDTLDSPPFDVEELKKAITNQYIQYWQSLQFLMVKEEHRSRSEKLVKKSAESNVTKQGSTKQSNKATSSKLDDAKSGEGIFPIYLYRASGCGIVIMEVGFVGMNLSLKLHVIEAMKFLHQYDSKQQMNVRFVNEYEHLKELTHAHSFMHDFHLRYMQMYIQGRQTAIEPGYNFLSFLQDFSRFYATVPDCVVNSLYCGEMSAKCSHVSPEKLYDYLKKEAENLGMKALKLTQDKEDGCEHALVSSHLGFDKSHTLSCNVEEHDAYDSGYVIWLDAKSQEHKKIKLKFFLIFTNRKHVFPRLDRRDEISPKIFPLLRAPTSVTPQAAKARIFAQQGRKYSTEIKTSTLPPVSSVSQIQGLESTSASVSMASAVMQSQGRRKSMPNFGAALQDSKMKPRNVVAQLLKAQDEQNSDVTHESENSSFVKCEKKRLSDYLEGICQSSEIQCYRDHLWQLILTDVPLQNQPSLLTIEDFEHLLKHCQKIPLENLDKRGAVLCDTAAMGVPWALTVQKLLLAKFKDHGRYFINASETKKYLSVVNPKLTAMLFLVAVETDIKEIGMFAILRDKIAELDVENPDISLSGNPIIDGLRTFLNNVLELISFQTWTSLFS